MQNEQKKKGAHDGDNFENTLIDQNWMSFVLQ